jgi:cell division protein FtsQ
MRSLNLVRKSRNNPRAKTNRKPVRGKRELASVQPGSGRKDKGERRFSRPMLWLASASVCLALLAVLVVSGFAGRTVHRVNNAFSAMVADAGFGVYEIQINGNRRVPTQSIFAALGLTAGQSIFSVDLPAARARIMALDWIASADVVRRYPGTVTVTVVEKRPFALWQSPNLGNGAVAVVERSGGVITTQEVEKFARLPKLIGAGAPEHAAELVEATIAHRAISARIAAYERVSDRRWNLILNDGVVVKLPETGWARQLDELETLIVDKSILEKNVSEIDLRAPTHYFFVLKSGEQKNVERGKDT